MVRAKTKKLDDVCLLVYPDEKEVVLDVTLHATLEDAMKFVRIVFKWHTACPFKMLDNSTQGFNFCRLVEVSLEVLLESCRAYDGLHCMMDLTKAS